jgi:transposase-like protein
MSLRPCSSSYPDSSWIYIRRFVTVDSTFLKGRFIQQLLLAVGIDANSNTLILAWAIIKSENENSWNYFFRHLAAVTPDIMDKTTVLVSDRNKGIAAADPELGPEILRVVCA